MSNSAADRLWPSWAPRPAEPEWGTAEYIRHLTREDIKKNGPLPLGGGLLLTLPAAATTTAQSPGQRIWRDWNP